MSEPSRRPTRSVRGLPADTVSMLKSGQTLQDPVALIKELVENSLDARATQIWIDVSANLLDSVVVRDNGDGIEPQRRVLVCLPHHTSKIRSVDGIRMVASLGFRGEALASASRSRKRCRSPPNWGASSLGRSARSARMGPLQERVSALRSG
jgi:DNA mismatch repair ATPase MutL